MSGSDAVVAVAVFLASAVEMVEALTIVLAAGVTRGWRSALEGTAVALLVLAVLVAALGPAIIHYVPLSTLRVTIGGVLLIFGLQWLRKAVLRAAGLKAKHDEDAIYNEHVNGLGAIPRSVGRDALGFTIAFKGVFLEGLEVVIVVITLGTTDGHLGLAALSALAAVVIVGSAGITLSRQLSSVPENAMKLGVGLMLSSFGTFWSGEGIGVRWPGSDLWIPLLVAFYGAASWVLVVSLQRQRRTDAGIA